jgi:hypothetical protein
MMSVIAIPFLDGQATPPVNREAPFFVVHRVAHIFRCPTIYGGLVEDRKGRSVTYVLGLLCYLCARSVLGGCPTIYGGLVVVCD